MSFQISLPIFGNISIPNPFEKPKLTVMPIPIVNATPKPGTGSAGIIASANIVSAATQAAVANQQEKAKAEEQLKQVVAQNKSSVLIGSQAQNILSGGTPNNNVSIAQETINKTNAMSALAQGAELAPEQVQTAKQFQATNFNQNQNVATMTDVERMRALADVQRFQTSDTTSDMYFRQKEIIDKSSFAGLSNNPMTGFNASLANGALALRDKMVYEQNHMISQMDKIQQLKATLNPNNLFPHTGYSGAQIDSVKTAVGQGIQYVYSELAAQNEKTSADSARLKFDLLTGMNGAYDALTGQVDAVKAGLVSYKDVANNTEVSASGNKSALQSVQDYFKREGITLAPTEDASVGGKYIDNQKKVEYNKNTSSPEISQSDYERVLLHEASHEMQSTGKLGTTDALALSLSTNPKIKEDLNSDLYKNINQQRLIDETKAYYINEFYKGNLPRNAIVNEYEKALNTKTYTVSTLKGEAVISSQELVPVLTEKGQAFQKQLDVYNTDVTREQELVDKLNATVKMQTAKDEANPDILFQANRGFDKAIANAVTTGAIWKEEFYKQTDTGQEEFKLGQGGLEAAGKQISDIPKYIAGGFVFDLPIIGLESIKLGKDIFGEAGYTIGKTATGQAMQIDRTKTPILGTIASGGAYAVQHPEDAAIIAGIAGTGFIASQVESFIKSPAKSSGELTGQLIGFELAGGGAGKAVEPIKAGTYKLLTDVTSSRIAQTAADIVRTDVVPIVKGSIVKVGNSVVDLGVGIINKAGAPLFVAKRAIQEQIPTGSIYSRALIDRAVLVGKEGIESVLSKVNIPAIDLPVIAIDSYAREAKEFLSKFVPEKGLYEKGFVQRVSESIPALPRVEMPTFFERGLYDVSFSQRVSQKISDIAQRAKLPEVNLNLESISDLFGKGIYRKPYPLISLPKTELPTLFERGVYEKGLLEKISGVPSAIKQGAEYHFGRLTESSLYGTSLRRNIGEAFDVVKENVSTDIDVLKQQAGRTPDIIKQKLEGTVLDDALNLIDKYKAQASESITGTKTVIKKPFEIVSKKIGVSLDIADKRIAESIFGEDRIVVNKYSGLFGKQKTVVTDIKVFGGELGTTPLETSNIELITSTNVSKTVEERGKGFLNYGKKISSQTIEKEIPFDVSSFKTILQEDKELPIIINSSRERIGELKNIVGGEVKYIEAGSEEIANKVLGLNEKTIFKVKPLIGQEYKTGVFANEVYIEKLFSKPLGYDVSDAEIAERLANIGKKSATQTDRYFTEATINAGGKEFESLSILEEESIGKEMAKELKSVKGDIRQSAFEMEEAENFESITRFKSKIYVDIKPRTNINLKEMKGFEVKDFTGSTPNQELNDWAKEMYSGTKEIENLPIMQGGGTATALQDVAHQAQNIEVQFAQQNAEAFNYAKAQAKTMLEEIPAIARTTEPRMSRLYGLTVFDYGKQKEYSILEATTNYGISEQKAIARLIENTSNNAVQKTSTTLIPITIQKPMIIESEASKVINSIRGETDTRISTEEATKLFAGTQTFSDTVVVEKLAQRYAEATKLFAGTQTFSDTVVVEKLAQRYAEATKTKLKQKQEEKLIERLKFKDEPLKEKNGFPKLPKGYNQNYPIEKELEKAYNFYVRKSHGKGTKVQEEFVGRFPFNKGLNIVEEEILNEPAQTVVFKPAGYTEEQDVRFRKYDKYFRAPRGKTLRGLPAFVQRNPIQSIGEKESITRKGLAASRQKREQERLGRALNQFYGLRKKRR